MTKALLKYVQSLKQQKYRKAHKSYLVEGEKNVKEWLEGPAEVSLLLATEDWLSGHQDLLSSRRGMQVEYLRDFELAKLTALSTPAPVMLVAQMPPAPALPDFRGKWTLLLDGVRDPGNMGTLFRIADWFGIPFLLCSPDCVEPYNPKTVQASMGSLLRVPFIDMNPDELQGILADKPLPMYITGMKGENIFSLENPEPGIIIMGNESNGVRPDLQALATHFISIPGKGKGAESLNVSVAAGIITAVLCRQTLNPPLTAL